MTGSTGGKATTAPAAPASVTLFTGALAVVGIVTAAATGQFRPAGPWWTAAPLLAALVLAGGLQVEFNYRGHLEALDLFEAALLPSVLLFAGPVVVAMAVMAKAVSQRWLRVQGRKAAFNVAQWAACTGAASLVFVDLAGSHPSSATRLAALVAGMVAAMVVNHLSVAAVMALVSEVGLRGALGGLSEVIVPGWIIGGLINLAFGVIFAVVAWHTPALAALILVPLVMLHWAQGAYAEARADRTRLQALQQATHSLAAPMNPVEGVPPFLATVLECFRAAGVAVVVGRDVAFHQGDPATKAVCQAVADRMGRPAAALRVRAADGTAAGEVLAEAGRRSALVAPLRRDTEIVGLLVSLDRTGLAGFERGEVAVFEAVAAELANALHKGELHSALVGERAKLLDIVTRSSDGIFTVARDGSVETWNEAMETITGFPAAEAVGHRGLGVLRPRDASGAHVPFEDWASDDVGRLPSEIEVLTRDGAHRWLSCSLARTGSGPLVVVARDVTRQREVDRMKDDFVAAVSHELRTPLSAILGCTEMLTDRSRALNENQQERTLSMLRRGAHRLERLVSNLLEVTIVEARTAGASAGPLDMSLICAEVVDELRQSWPDAQLDIEPVPTSVQVRGKSASVEQILSNLVGNALKYGEGSPVVIGFEVAAGELVVKVVDRGPGIPEQHQERIFERFERLDHDHVQAGTGLGLYISRQLAQAMGGELSVESKPGRGATFRLRLPAEVRLTAVPAEDAARRGNRVG